MDVFVYGTLTDPERVAAVVEEWRFLGDAVLDGMHRIEGEYPSLAPGGTATGRLLRTSEIASLDAYEGVDRGLYVRTSVPRAGTDERAAVYVGDDEVLDADADAAWPGEGPLARRVRRFVRERGVTVRLRERRQPGV